MEISCDIVNNGTAAENTSNLEYFLTDNAVFDAGDSNLGSDAVPSLDIGASSSQYERIRIDAGTTPGPYYIVFIADAEKEVDEENESNNITVMQFNVINALPDLSISHINVDPASLRHNETINLECDVNNYSSVDAVTSIMKYFISDDLILSEEDRYLGSEVVAEIPAYSNVNLSAVFTIPDDLQIGPWHVLFYADADTEIEEIDETNNIGYFNIDVEAAAPDLILLNPAVDTNIIYVGYNIQTSVSVTNQSPTSSPSSLIEYYLSLDQAYDSADLFIGSNTIEELGTNASETVNNIMNIPDTINSGNWFVIFYIDRSELIDEIFEDNNQVFIPVQILNPLPDLTLTHLIISPQVLSAGNMVNISFDIYNMISFPSDSGSVNIYLSENSTFDINDHLLKTIYFEKLNGNDNQTINCELIIPESTSQGSKYLILIADPYKIIEETDEDNNGIFDRITVEERLGIDNKSFKNIIVYPNPGEGKFYVRNIRSVSEEVNIRVLSIEGKIVYNKTIYSENINLVETINIRGEKKGIYFLHIKSGKKYYFKKIIII